MIVCSQKNIIGSIETVKFDISQISIEKSTNLKNSFQIEKKNSKKKIQLLCENSNQFTNLLNEIDVIMKENYLP